MASKKAAWGIKVQLGDALTPTERRTPLYRHLYFQVLVAISLGVLVGFIYPDVGIALKPLGDGFVKLVKMIIAPVIFLTVVTGIAGLRDLGGLGRLSTKTFGYFFVVSTFALIVGLAVANLFQPGSGMNVDPAALDLKGLTQFAKQEHDQTITGFLTSIIPDTLMSSQIDGNILQVLLVATLFGIAAALTGDAAAPVVRFLESVSQIVFRLVHILMRAAPIGAFGAMGFTIGKYGISSLLNLAGLVALFYITSALFIVVVLGAIARFNGFSIFRLVAYLRQEIVLVLGTASSEVALPGLMEKLERAGCRRSIVGVVVPLGYSFNLDGTNIYMTLAALFVAQACNVDLTLGQQLLLLAVAMISSKGAAGVTGAGFITLAATLSIVPGVPVAGLALILGVDRFMSECRSVTNFIGNAVATITVARWEGGLDDVKLRAALTGGPAGAEAAEAAADDLVTAHVTADLAPPKFLVL